MLVPLKKKNWLDVDKAHSKDVEPKTKKYKISSDLVLFNIKKKQILIQLVDQLISWFPIIQQFQPVVYHFKWLIKNEVGKCPYRITVTTKLKGIHVIIIGNNSLTIVCVDVRAVECSCSMKENEHCKYNGVNSLLQINCIASC